ncbi:MAG TPA: hypothetical protein VG267_03720 [Terracidiphilus sp.]|jgi:hypothetical protein|nr:hypothetical protein [Terracidiphilus sp.]
MTLVRTIQGTKLRLECAATLRRQGEAVLNTFERLYSTAGSLRAGAQIRFGWSLLHVLDDAGWLMVAEPEFERWPEERWRPNLDTTLRIATEQSRLLQRLRLSGEDACYDQFLFAAPGAHLKRDIFLKRSGATLDRDSGWALGALDDPEALGADQLEAIPIAKLVGTLEYAMQVLALPGGSIAIFRNASLSEILDAGGNILLPGDGSAEASRN